MDDSILSGLTLQDEQQDAAFYQGGDIAVLAGAGCGKTTTLVARYLYLLACGVDPSEIVAITFTERAGREMRTRIREALRRYLATQPADRDGWLERYIALDAAPIGTIHSYCAQLLRGHPAEAGLDPDFVVLEESQAGMLAAEAVERALVWAAGREEVAGGFRLFGPRGLRDIVAELLHRRLEAGPALALDAAELQARWQAAPLEWLAAVLAALAWAECLERLQALEPLEPGDTLDDCRRGAIDAVPAAREAVKKGDWEAALAALSDRLRRPGSAGGKRAWGERAAEVRATLRTLCDLYHSRVKRFVEKADRALDQELAAAWPGLAATCQRALADYEALKAQGQALDFDDLEAGALRLLQAHPEVAAYRRARCKAVLVDEFQDTNERQRRLIEALLGAPAGQAGRLFVVGDAKQSIYRFRGADVTVFRNVEQEIDRAGGRIVRLERTWRAHAALVELLNELLAAVLGDGDDPARPYAVPFAPLTAAGGRAPRLAAPYVELHLGVGASADEGRQVAAQALAGRLLGLHATEGLAWRDVACLFRAGTNFGVYEEALERAGIPYVTVAGAGFYERPEVRDLLNALRALEHPSDDLAMAGLLRSPACGLADASLYRLRWGTGGGPQPLWAALQGDLRALEAAEQARARRMAAIVAELHPQVGRQPVALVLKRFLDLSAYPAMLSLVPQSRRAGRNVDKLLADAHRSGAVSVGDLLAYVQALRDVAAREGEAPPEAGEAVQLMSVHKAKGLEFGLVVIADAGHEGGGRTPALLVHPAWGPLLRVTRADGAERREGLLHALARAREAELEDAEERRLLYVAATRARDKLLVSGHAQRGKEGLRLSGWLRRLAGALGEEALAAVAMPEPGAQSASDLWPGRVACALYGAEPSVGAGRTTTAPSPSEGEGRGEGETPCERPTARPSEPLPAGPEAGQVEESPLTLTLSPAGERELARLATPSPFALARPYGAAPAGEAGRDRVPEAPDRVWRVVPRRRGLHAPAWLVGKLVHVGLRLWRFPGEPGLDEALRAAARSAGLADEGQIAGAAAEAARLLARFRRSELCRELEVGERRHEVPYGLPADPWGRIDLLAQRPDGAWWLLDFKTDRLQGEAELRARVEKYAPQLRRYGQAATALLGQAPRLLLCFLDYEGKVHLQEVDSGQ